MSQQTVTAVDGTPIAYWHSGDGPPLILVHGSFDDHNVWAPVLPAFEEHFTVYAVDRRGRGGSGDGTGYSLESEAADIAEVVESIGGQEINLLGHSYGGVCALEAARRTPHLRRLVLYEPAVPAGIPFPRRGLSSASRRWLGKATERIPVGRRAWRRPTPCRARCVW
jgi:pimeloyl-ACP methyl ester carboxylesterase